MRMLISCHSSGVPPVPTEQAKPLTLTLTDPQAYGRSFSETYDSWYSTVTDAEATAGFVADRCPGGVVLELGVGTGRLAVMLRRQGLEVIGLDASDSMLRRCPADVHRLQADMTQPPLRPGLDTIVLCGFNTVFNLASEQLQQNLFHRIRPLASVLILETMELAEPSGNGTRSVAADSQVGLKQVVDGTVVVTTTSQDAARQTVVGRHLEISNEAVVSRPWMLRWATVRQLDAMAAKAGFDLSERYGSWDETPWPGSVGNEPSVAISVYR